MTIKPTDSVHRKQPPSDLNFFLEFEYPSPYREDTAFRVIQFTRSTAWAADQYYVAILSADTPVERCDPQQVFGVAWVWESAATLLGVNQIVTNWLGRGEA